MNIFIMFLIFFYSCHNQTYQKSIPLYQVYANMYVLFAKLWL